MNWLRLNLLCVAVVLLTLMGCDGRKPGSNDDAGVPPDGAATDGVACVDESIAQLMLFDTVAAGEIADEAAAEGEWISHIDAAAGGSSPTQGYVYARFDEDGLHKVDIDDESAFESTDWHIAIRRFVLRLNSGVSGPGVVRAARTAPGTSFETLDAVPASLDLRDERYFTDTCEYVSDGTGIGAPASALASFWRYAGCVAMTGNVYVVALPDGRHVKLQVLSYYAPEVQRGCDESNRVSDPSSAGNIRIRWSFLD